MTSLYGLQIVTPLLHIMVLDQVMQQDSVMQVVGYTRVFAVTLTC